MPRHMFTFLLKIAVVSSVFVVALQAYSVFTTQEISQETAKTNKQTFQSAYTTNYANVWVALSTRIWIAFSDGESSTNGLSFYRNQSGVWASSEEKKAIRESLIKENMFIVWDYLNLSRTDIKSLLDSSSDRQRTLEWFISQLELKYKNSALSIESLEAQKADLLVYLEQIDTQIENTKVSMEENFSLWQSTQTLANVDSYFELRKEYTQAFTDIVFINQFLKQHSFLNNYNKGILDTLINNKKAIIDRSYVVIPDSGSQYLRPLELIFDEAEIKQLQEKNWE